MNIWLPNEISRLSRVMQIVLIALNIVAGLVVTFNIPHELGIQTVAYLVMLIGLSVVIRHRRIQIWLTRHMSSRWVIVIIGCLTVGFGALLDGLVPVKTLPLLWSAMRTWQATVFWWAISYGAIAYAQKRFEWTSERKRHWGVLLAMAIILGILSPIFNWIRPVYEPQYEYAKQSTVPDIVARYADQNSDAAYLYVPTMLDFPYQLRYYNGVLHRSTAYLVASQICLVMDIGVYGYADLETSCTRAELGVVPYWVMNTLWLCICLIIFYELAFYYFKKPNVGFYAAILMALCPLNIWFMAIPSTDYGDLFITFLSLWMLHDIFTFHKIRLIDSIFYGIVFGVLLLYKLMAMNLILAVFLALLLRRSRPVLISISVAFLTLIIYRFLVQAFGIRFDIVEAYGWGSFIWLITDFIYYSPYEQAKSLSLWVSYMVGHMAMMYGVLLPIGLGVLTISHQISKRLTILFWVMCISTFAWMMGFKYAYNIHVIGFATLVYGSVAYGVFALRDRLLSYPKRAWLVKLILILPLLHNVLQWFTWTSRHEMYYNFFFRLG